MNKLLIVLLAVCLVSVHAFVKRDAPEAAPSSPSSTQDLQKQIESFAAKAKDIGEDISKKVAEVLDPEKIKKQVNEIVNAATKAFEDLKPKADAPKPAA